MASLQTHPSLSLALSLPLAYGAPAFWLTPLMWIDQNSRFVSFFHPVWSRDPKPHSAPLSFSYSAGWQTLHVERAKRGSIDIGFRRLRRALVGWKKKERDVNIHKGLYLPLTSSLRPRGLKNKNGKLSLSVHFRSNCCAFSITKRILFLSKRARTHIAD